MTSQKGWLCRKKDEFYTSIFVDYPPEIIKEIRLLLGETEESFARIFYVTEGTVKDWETVSGDHKRRMKGGNVRIMNDLAKIAYAKKSSKETRLKLFMDRKRKYLKDLEVMYGT